MHSSLKKFLRESKKEYYTISYFNQSGNINSGYCAFYDYLIENVKKPDEETLKVWEIFKQVSEELHYFFVFEDFVFCSEKPLKLNFRNNLLHGENKPSVLYKDGYSIYKWNGIEVPEQLIMQSETITRQDILSIENAELRKCYLEKLGAKKYYDIITEGKGLTLIDSVIDNQHNVMKLWQTKNNDDLLKRPVQFLECECPSTGDIFNIYPTKDCKTAWEAKNSTFNNEKGMIRQGDVMLKEINHDYEYPLIET